MAKPIIKFNVVPYKVGDYSGNRVQFEPKDGVFDLDFCTEVVNTKRLATSPDQLFHDVKMLAEVAGIKINEDGRPRGITKLIKWTAYALGTVESPSSPWNPETCKAVIRPVLLKDSVKTLDATFQNTTEGIGVRLNDVTWLGAMTVQNVLKIGADFSANGSHMEFIDGDSAVLKVGEIEYALENTGSDVSHAFFAFPAALSDVEPGTQATFIMKSRGGVVDGQVYTVKKTVTILAGDVPKAPKLTRLHSTKLGTDGEIKFEGGDTLEIEGASFTEDAALKFELYNPEGALVCDMPYTRGNALERVSDKKLVYTFVENTSPQPDGLWTDPTYVKKIKVITAAGEATMEIEAK